METSSSSREIDARADRAYGALLGLAIGDALGMPTQGFTRVEVARRWGVLTGFEAAPADNAISAGMAAARVTDDTDQAVILGGLLITGRGRVDPYAFGRALQKWEAEMAATGSLDLLGPSTKRALNALAAGVPPDQSGRSGTTNGAAMRVTPVGIATPPEPLDALVDAVEDSSRVTHHTAVAIAGAAALAAAVSAGIAGWAADAAFRHGVAAARVGAHRGASIADGPVVADCIERALAMATSSRQDEVALLDAVTTRIGTSLATHESVPAAFAIAAAYSKEPWLACCAAASLGGDSDTIAAMTGALLGALLGAAAFPSSAVAAMLGANPGLDLLALSRDLLALRQTLEDV